MLTASCRQIWNCWRNESHCRRLVCWRTATAVFTLSSMDWGSAIAYRATGLSDWITDIYWLCYYW